MGAPKQKWTAEEETALRAGVARYGIGKWSAILKDPEFSTVLRARSNVDLKDKWRNIHVMENGLGSRQRGKISSKSTQLPPRLDHNSAVLSPLAEKIQEVHDATKALTVYAETPSIPTFKKSISRLQDLIIEAVAKLKEPHGSTRTSIASYIEELYLAPSDFEKIVAANLKQLTESGRLIKVNHHYRLSPTPIPTRVHMPLSPPGAVQISSSSRERKDDKIITKAQIDNELDAMRGMTAQEAAAAAAKAVAEAEAAIAEAEHAAREADMAEAEAEAAVCFAEAARKALNCRTSIHAW